MKNIILFSSLAMFFLGCIPSPTPKPSSTVQASFYKENKAFEKLAAVDLIADVAIIDTVTGADTPLDEASEDVKSLDIATASIFTDKMIFLDSFSLKKKEPNIKGQIKSFKTPFAGVNEGKIKFKMNFSGNNGDTFFDVPDYDITLKAKSLYRAVLKLDQTSIKRDSTLKAKAKLNIEEIKADEYVPNQILIGAKMTEADVKKLLEKEGVKVTELKKGLLDNYTVTFSEPSISEALIISSKINKFDYVELNGIVQKISF